MKPGQTVGQTDEFGFSAVDAPIEITRSSGKHPASPSTRSRKADIPFSGRDFHLTNVKGHMLKVCLPDAEDLEL
jgi:hypothetical protein